MTSMQKYDNLFNVFSKKLNVDGQYDAGNINFDCLRASIDGFEGRYGRFTDYGFGFIKFIAKACETYPSSVILEELNI